MDKKKRWSRVSILTALLDEVNNLIEENPQLGYNSAASFVNDAVRRLLENAKKELSAKLVELAPESSKIKKMALELLRSKSTC